MAARKLQQEVEKCFKKVGEGVVEFESIYEKLEQSTNPGQKEKLEDNLKREIKKLQRMRDQIKTWASSNDIKDKGPLLDHRRLIETQMEKFKAIEKAMKTKAYSKEGLSAAAKLDPKEQAKVEAGEFLAGMVDELEQQIETLEAESESLQATAKKGKLHGAKADRMAEIEHIIERHKWHQGKLELIRRSLENGGVETEQVNDLEENIRYYVTDGMNGDFPEDDEMYNDLNLDDEEDAYGMNLDNDKGSSQDGKSEAEEGQQLLLPLPPLPLPQQPAPAPAPAPPQPLPPLPPQQQQNQDEKETGRVPPPGKVRSVAENALAGRKTSGQTKSPLPAPATLHAPLPTISNGSSSVAMKPASVPARPAGEGLKYASAAAAAALQEKNVGIAPLPPPPGFGPFSGPSRSSAANSPALATVQPAPHHAVASPALSVARLAPGTPVQQATPKTEPAKLARGLTAKAAAPPSAQSVPTPAPTPVPAPAPILRPAETSKAPATTTTAAPTATAAATAAPTSRAAPTATAQRVNGLTNGNRLVEDEEEEKEDEEEEDEEVEEESVDDCIYHLPASLRHLVESFDEMTRKRAAPPVSQQSLHMLGLSGRTCPSTLELNVPRRHCPATPMPVMGSEFPLEPLEILDDPRLYNRMDTDTLFFLFYYKQGSAQQYLAARALKEQSWRFHKQYQTWFQRHEEPKNITDEFEQGTYRFFDYESTWMNRRKADFKFAYRFLEDEIEV